MEIRRLSWDSAFFEREVYSADLQEGEDLGALGELVGPCLVYLFLDSDNGSVRLELESRGALFCGSKIVYHKDLKQTIPNEPVFNVEEYNGVLEGDLESLAYQAGAFSRFNLDPGLSAYFKPLFKEWMIKSLERKMADKTFVCRNGSGIVGFASCSVNDGKGRLGLISVDQSVQGSGIGKSLLAAVESYFQVNQVCDSYIVTQGENIVACSFYETTGYITHKRSAVYHLWLDV